MLLRRSGCLGLRRAQSSIAKPTRPSPTFSLSPAPPTFAPNPHTRSITDGFFLQLMDASTPLKRSSTDAGLDSPRESNRSTESRSVAPRISKARACTSATSPTFSDRSTFIHD